MHLTLTRNENALLYACGFGCDNAILIEGKKSYFVTDGRYTLDAKECVKSGVIVVDGGRDLIKKTRELIRKESVGSVVIDPNEWSMELGDRLFSKLHVHLRKIKNLSHKKRLIKSDDELETIRKAVKIGQRAFEEFFEFVGESGVGLSEKELSYEAKRVLSHKGKYDLSFEPIVAINQNSAKPHAIASDLVLKEGDLLLFDAGIKYKGYCSDRTRTVEVGKNMSDNKSQIFTCTLKQKVYDIVLKAKEEAIKAVHVGASLKDVDRVARDVIEKSGYGKFFVHSTGHGVGLDIHEMPYVGANSSGLIEENMVFTIEPGIYLSDEFGVRIEDMVVAKASGVEVL